MASHRIISNSSPLINLSKIQQLTLLYDLYEEVVIPTAVYEETVTDGAGRPGSQAIKKLCKEGKIITKEVKNKNLITALRKDLDKGEAEVIALALELEHNLVLLDETEARKMAASYQLHFTGFIGVLLKAYNSGIIDNFRANLDKAIELGFYINDSLYEKLINRVK